MPDRLTLIAPDDWHVHLRDDEMLARVIGHTAQSFRRAIVMPNLRPPVTSVDAAIAYRERILGVCPSGVSFEPLMTAYLTDHIAADELKRGFQDGVFTAPSFIPRTPPPIPTPVSPALRASMRSSAAWNTSACRC